MAQDLASALSVAGPQGQGVPGGAPSAIPNTAAALQQQPIRPARNFAKEWSDFLAQPGARQMMVQMGVSLLQPVGLGQTTLGHIGQAVGQGAEARTRFLEGEETREQATRALDIKEQEAENRTAGRTSATASVLLSNARLLGAEFTDFLWKYAQGLAEQESFDDPTIEPDARALEIFQAVTSDPAKVQQLKQSWQTAMSAGGGSAALDATGNSQPATLGEAVPKSVEPPPEALQLLRSNPELAQQFDAKYGAGMSERYLKVR